MVGSCQFELIHHWELFLDGSSPEKGKEIHLKRIFDCFYLISTFGSNGWIVVFGSIKLDALGIKRYPRSHCGCLRTFSQSFYDIWAAHFPSESKQRCPDPVDCSGKAPKDSIILETTLRNINLVHGASHEEYALSRGIQGIQGWLFGIFLQLGFREKVKEKHLHNVEEKHLLSDYFNFFSMKSSF